MDPPFHMSKNIRDSWYEVKITLTGVWGKLILTFKDSFAGFKTSVGEVIAVMVGITKEL